MHSSQLNNSSRRANPFSRNSPSPSPGPQVAPSQPKSVAFPPSTGDTEKKSHTRNSSLSHFSSTTLASNNHQRSGSLRHNVEVSGTFAPQFIKSEELRREADQIQGMEGANDFSGKRYVWLKDAEKAFVRGQVIGELENGDLLVRCDDGSVWVSVAFRE